ncbi:MAG: elongation factor 4 [Spiroplasma poulsonii]|uniref:Elongation factor 4 n=1 Tax=Spiroplasma poulsonii TaxID=2138 RepID=A0A2P6FE21_9MOLU|nr:translation elongation factor 4 [Spiroplasma poulsonii]KAF0850689.1 Elongation factor 4 [Spiroplasma poulsonii]MBW1241967.1 elongation factor 4 [Spiroplasma poulsonii]PQM31699.1 Elongation factor 4 [Spiroplasma poulsonii]PWF96730.1 Elongation factor 4 [Spiroplasma poulsonii]PWF97305.1 Elongation factor 4 [Spiroplasma poulsonii]
MDKKLIRNFSIIAHIDHGKSTLADRILELTGTVDKREMQEQLLDSMDLERERGITIKLNSVQLKYHAKDNQEYIFHLIDTPGHVDFTYEVSRSLAACEGAILVVDAAQGIEAQTLANVYLAIDNNLEIIPVINKIDLPSADPERVKEEIEKLIGIPTTNAPLISAKTGLNIDQVLEAIVQYIPAPLDADDNKPLQALIFDSHYDKYRGVMVSIRIKQGTVHIGDKIKLMNTNAIYEVTELGVKTPKEVKKDFLVAGEVGWLAASIKMVRDVRVGDTITTVANPAVEPLSGYKKMNPMVFCGLYTIDSAKYKDLKEALEKIQLSDASLVYEPETSQALGFGFRCGFLGLLHMDVIQERLEREYNLELIATAPSVIYHVYLTNKEMITIDNPSDLPPVQKIDRIEEPFVKATIMTPDQYIGPLMELCQNKRGTYVNLEYIDDTRRILTYEMPLNEIVFDFFDRLKSISKGYASLDYEFIGYRPNKLVKMDILLNGDVIDALSIIVHRDFAYGRGKALCAKLKEIIPRQNFEVPIQAAINHKVIAREDIKAMRKNVLAKCYGGDITRKKKLLEKQKEGKKRMKAIGSVEVPQEAFMAVLKLDD